MKTPLTNRQWEAIHTAAGRDVMDIVRDLRDGRATDLQTMEHIATHCEMAFLLGRKVGRREVKR